MVTPLLFVVSSVPLLKTNVLVVLLGAIAKFKVPLPAAFTCKVSVAEPPLIALALIVKTSLLLVIFSVSLVVPLLGNALPPLNVSLAVPLSTNTAPFVNVIAFANVALLDGVKLSVASFTVILPVPTGPLVILPGLPAVPVVNVNVPLLTTVPPV